MTNLQTALRGLKVLEGGAKPQLIVAKPFNDNEGYARSSLVLPGWYAKKTELPLGAGIPFFIDAGEIIHSEARTAYFLYSFTLFQNRAVFEEFARERGNINAWPVDRGEAIYAGKRELVFPRGFTLRADELYEFRCNLLVGRSQIKMQGLNEKLVGNKQGGE